MKRLVLAALLVASSARAQPTPAQFDSLRADNIQLRAMVTELRDIVGVTTGNCSIPVSADTVRPVELPNGDYNYCFRIHQLGRSWNGIVPKFEGIPPSSTIVDAIREGQLPIIMKLPPAGRTVVEYVNSAIVAAGTGTGAGAQGPPGPPGPMGPPGGSSGPAVGGVGIDGAVYMFPDGSEQWRSNSRHLASQGGITSEYCGQISINGWDGGFRMTQNRKDNSEQSCAPMLQWGYWGPDSRATWSYAQYPSANTAASFSAIETYGQSLIIDGGFGQPGYQYAADLPLALRGVLIAAQRGGQSLMLAVSPGRQVGGAPSNRVFLRGVPDGSPNPVEIVLDNALRRLKSCNIGGIQVVCF